MAFVNENSMDLNQSMSQIGSEKTAVSGSFLLSSSTIKIILPNGMEWSKISTSGIDTKIHY